MSPDEEQLWIKIQRKDREAFEQLYKEHYRFFFLASCKYLGEPVLAQEVVNDVFLRVWEDAGTIEIKTSLKFYLHRAVVNRSLNELDKLKREQQRRQGFLPGTGETPESREMEEDELRIRLYRAIDELPEQCRKVFKMSRFEKLKQQEIADQLGISIKTVKNHITHALKILSKVARSLDVFFCLI